MIDGKLELLEVSARIPFWVLWVIGFFVDAAGFAIARTLPKPDKSWESDERAWWIIGFFFFQVALVVCLVFYVPGNVFAQSGKLLVFVATAFSIAAYARADFSELFKTGDNE